MASKPNRPRDKAQLAKIVGGAAAMLLIGMVGRFEGRSNDPYYDIVHVQTVCYGETRVEMRHYSDAECDDMLSSSLADFAQPVVARNPELLGHPNQLAAAVSLAYNIGPANYRRSTVARDFSLGQWRAACDAFLMWNRSGGRVVAGLTNRRKTERRLCLEDL